MIIGMIGTYVLLPKNELGARFQIDGTMRFIAAYGKREEAFNVLLKDFSKGVKRPCLKP